jgi:ribosomal protein S18 acetylase RimI-like enzyme
MKRNPNHTVALYVAHDNPAAQSVYQKVGFLGLEKGSLPVEGVDPWIEIGFDRSRVTLGHW